MVARQFPTTITATDTIMTLKLFFAKTTVYAALATAVVLLASCGPKRPGSRVALVCGKDTLTLDQVSSLVPDTSLPESLMIVRAAREVALGQCLAAPSADDGLINELKEQLSLQSGVQWKPNAARALLRSAQSLYIRSRQRGTAGDLAGFADSAIRALVSSPAAKNCGYSLPAAISDTAAVTDTKALGEAISSILIVPKRIAPVLCDFALSGSHAADDSAHLKAMIKGLLSDAPPRATQAKAPPKPVDAKIALKYPSQESIKESIEKHSVDIKELYKKNLKQFRMMRGTVWIGFQVAPSGEVVKAAIKSTEINQKELLDPLLEYAKTIRFKQIPENIGIMSFIFPFEFSPE